MNRRKEKTDLARRRYLRLVGIECPYRVSFTGYIDVWANNKKNFMEIENQCINKLKKSSFHFTSIAEIRSLKEGY